ncbi:copper chaperone PCu(A)C [uncultured Aureimonas sp.]|uniref:copper chaperone PCu(A)C n=1 Tax=uncultured Aureimonas sp. TaxID=1604662 RepID=UPI0025D715B1|nr:copper chaperone PCu(A)C [uncultured Aureimonas sp.]
MTTNTCPLHKRARRAACLLLLLLGATFAAGTANVQAHEFKVGSIEIEHPWSRATPPGARTGAGYLALSNAGTTADRLVSAASPVAEKVEVHEMTIVDGVMNMKQVAGGIEIPAGGEARLAPGGFHLMLIGIREPFKQGALVPVTLTFEKAGPVEVELEVGSMGAKEPANDHGHGAADPAQAH